MSDADMKIRKNWLTGVSIFAVVTGFSLCAYLTAGLAGFLP